MQRQTNIHVFHDDKSEDFQSHPKRGIRLFVKIVIIKKNVKLQCYQNRFELDTIHFIDFFQFTKGKNLLSYNVINQDTTRGGKPYIGEEWCPVK